MMESRPVDALVEAALKAYEAPEGFKVEFKPGAKDAAVEAPEELGEEEEKTEKTDEDDSRED